MLDETAIQSVVSWSPIPDSFVIKVRIHSPLLCQTLISTGHERIFKDCLAPDFQTFELRKFCPTTQ